MKKVTMDPRAVDLGLNSQELADIIQICRKFINAKDSLEDLLQTAFYGLSVAFSNYADYDCIDDALAGNKRVLESRRPFIRRVVTNTLINDLQPKQRDFIYSAVPLSENRLTPRQACAKFNAPESLDDIFSTVDDCYCGCSITSPNNLGDCSNIPSDMHVDYLLGHLDDETSTIIRHIVLRGESRASVARKMHLSAAYVRDTWFRGVATLQLLISSGIN